MFKICNFFESRFKNHSIFRRAHKYINERRDKVKPDNYEEITTEIRKITLELVEHERFTTEREILCSLIESRQMKSIYKKYIKQTVYSMLQTHGLVRCRLNKHLRQKFNIVDFDGYPIIIYKK
jgi:hypothetical protein